MREMGDFNYIGVASGNYMDRVGVLTKGHLAGRYFLTEELGVDIESLGTGGYKAFLKPLELGISSHGGTLAQSLGNLRMHIVLLHNKIVSSPMGNNREVRECLASVISEESLSRIVVANKISRIVYRAFVDEPMREEDMPCF